MANTKSAEKAARQSKKRQAANRIYIGGARTSVKKARVAINGDAANADTDQREPNAVPEHESSNIVGGRAKRDTDAQFPNALAHAVRRHSVGTDDREGEHEQRECSHNEHLESLLGD